MRHGASLSKKGSIFDRRSGFVENNLIICIDAMNLEHVLGNIDADRVNLHVDGPLNVIRLQRSPYGTSMPGAGAVHHIRLSGAMEKYPPGATENCPPRGVEDEGGF